MKELFKILFVASGLFTAIGFFEAIWLTQSAFAILFCLGWTCLVALYLKAQEDFIS